MIYKIVLKGIYLKNYQKRVWVAWEDHRRSKELSKSFGCRLKIIDKEGLLRYPISIIETILFYINEKPEVIFVQNPSMILAFISCVYSKLYNIKIVVDRHSNFLFSRKKSRFYVFVFKILSAFTIRTADLTLVSNKYIGKLITVNKGRFAILPDKIPDLKPKSKIVFTSKHSVLMVASHATDEPIQEVFKAFESLVSKDIALFITGNYKRLNNEFIKRKPENVFFTGFLDDQQYIDMLSSVDVVLVLTTNDYCMLCGCYETMAVRNVLVTSRKQVLVNYFKGALFVDNSSKNISKGVSDAIIQNDSLKLQIRNNVKRLVSQWREAFDKIDNAILMMTYHGNK